MRKKSSTVLSPAKMNLSSDSDSVPTPKLSPVCSPKVEVRKSVRLSNSSLPVAEPLDSSSFICYVCRRRLASAEMLRKHEELSALHQKNLKALQVVDSRKRNEMRLEVVRLRNARESPEQVRELLCAEFDLGLCQEEFERKSGSLIELETCVEFEECILEMKGSSWTGNKPTNEDRMVLGFEISPTIRGCLVADGHCGDACADYIVTHLVENLRKTYSQKNSTNISSMELTIAVLNAFKITDENFITLAVQNQIPAGSTVVMLLFFKDVPAVESVNADVPFAETSDEPVDAPLAESSVVPGLPLADSSDGSNAVSHVPPTWSVLVAHLGDSRALMIRDEVVVRLSEDHKPDRPDEKERLENAGGHVVDVGGVWRVFTPGIVSIGGRALQWGLAVSKAFGDLALKLPTPIVSAVPEISVFKNVSSEAIFVLACDGIFDVLSDSETGQIAASGDPNAILQKSYGKLSDDNLTAVIVRMTKHVEHPVDEVHHVDDAPNVDDTAFQDVRESPGGLKHDLNSPSDDSVFKKARISDFFHDAESPKPPSGKTAFRRAKGEFDDD